MTLPGQSATLHDLRGSRRACGYFIGRPEPEGVSWGAWYRAERVHGTAPDTVNAYGAVEHYLDRLP